MASSGSEQAHFPFKVIRVIPYAVYSGALNMALDHFFASQLSGGDAPVLRFFGWSPYTLSLGYHQNDGTVDKDLLKKDGYDLVRRPTGGSAILHSEELTYSIVIPLEKYSHHRLYEWFHAQVAEALQTLGYPVELQNTNQNGNYLKQDSKNFACFNRTARSEIQYNKRKLVGSAQKVYRTSVLQHGSILLGPHQHRIIRYLVGSDTDKNTYLETLRRSSIALQEIDGRMVSPLEISEMIARQIDRSNEIGLEYQKLSKIELTNAEKFVKNFQII